MSNSIQTGLIVEAIIVISVVLVCIASIAYDRLVAKQNKLEFKIDRLDNEIKQVAKDVHELASQIRASRQS